MLTTAHNHVIAHVSISSMESVPLTATKVAVLLAQFIKSAAALQRHANASTLASLNDTSKRGSRSTLVR
jgi:hypothetical protein